jgi:hypothetical protein
MKDLWCNGVAKQEEKYKWKCRYRMSIGYVVLGKQSKHT